MPEGGKGITPEGGKEVKTEGGIGARGFTLLIFYVL